MSFDPLDSSAPDSSEAAEAEATMDEVGGPAADAFDGQEGLASGLPEEFSEPDSGPEDGPHVDVLASPAGSETASDTAPVAAGSETASDTAPVAARPQEGAESTLAAAATSGGEPLDQKAPGGMRTASFVKQLPDMRGAVPAKEDVVILGNEGPKVLQQVSNAVEVAYINTRQMVKERFTRAPQRTRDEVTMQQQMTLKRIQFQCRRTVQALETYKRQLQELCKKELEMSTFLQRKGVRDATPVGHVMRSFAAAQKCLSSDRKSSLLAAVEAFLSAVQSFVKTVIADMEVTMAKVEKARVAYDSQRRWLEDIEKVKEKKPAKHAQVTESMQKAEQEYAAIKKVAATKITMLDDHRAQLFSVHLQRLHAAQVVQASKAVNVLDSTTSAQDSVAVSA